MTNSIYDDYYNYLATKVITPFYEKRLAGLKSLKLTNVLRSKNPYLFKAKNIELAGELVKSIVDAFLSSREETIFGNLLENFAIYVSERLYGGVKSEMKSIDLEFERGDIYYVVGIKSGIVWGNSDQIAAMKNNFKNARAILRERGIGLEIIAVNGCIYGQEKFPLKIHHNRKDKSYDPEKDYYKYAGQEFWRFISDDDHLYQEIIRPIDYEARQKDEIFKAAYSQKVNEMTQDFIELFMKNHQIDWIKLVDFVSKKA